MVMISPFSSATLEDCKFLPDRIKALQTLYSVSINTTTYAHYKLELNFYVFLFFQENKPAIRAALGRYMSVFVDYVLDLNLVVLCTCCSCVI